MFRITDNLATHGLGETTYPATTLQEGFLDDFWIVDVRDMLDEWQPVDAYRKKIDYAIACLKEHRRIVICCGAGQSRSPAIAIAVLMKQHDMDFDSAYNLVKGQVPIADIEPCHISRLKELFNIGPA